MLFSRQPQMHLSRFSKFRRMPCSRTLELLFELPLRIDERTFSLRACKKSNGFDVWRLQLELKNWAPQLYEGLTQHFQISPPERQVPPSVDLDALRIKDWLLRRAHGPGHRIKTRPTKNRPTAVHHLFHWQTISPIICHRVLEARWERLLFLGALRERLRLLEVRVPMLSLMCFTRDFRCFPDPRFFPDCRAATLAPSLSFSRLTRE